MNPFVSYLALLGKLILLIGVCLNSVAIYLRIHKSFPYFPFATFSILPFFLIYKIISAWGKNSSLEFIYLAILILINLFFLSQLIREKNELNKILRFTLKIIRSHRSFIYLLIGIFVFFCFRGLYLEYPGDAIVYLQRVGLANQDTDLNLNSLWQYQSTNVFFSSFEQWLVGTDKWLRDQLTIIAAINAVILCAVTYRLAFWSTQKQRNSLIAVLLSLAFYGNLQINFYLYKILQSATLAMIVYLEILPIIYDFLVTPKNCDVHDKNKIFNLLFLILALWICLDCHQEKLLYVFSILMSASALMTIKSIMERQKPTFVMVGLLCLTLILSLALFLRDKNFIYLDAQLVDRWFSIGDFDFLTYWPNHSSSYLLLDFVSLGLALVVISSAGSRSRYFFIASVTLAPILFFLNPVAVTGLLKLTNSANIYRLAIGGIPWVFLPMACSYLEDKKDIKLNVLPLIFVLLGLLAYTPILGKYPHLLMQTPGYADGKDLTPIIDHLLDYQYEYSEDPLNILSEPYTNSYLMAWPQFNVVSNRWITSNAEQYDPELAYLFSEQISAHEISEKLRSEDYEFVILNLRESLNYQSWLGRMTNHWSPWVIQEHRELFSGKSLYRYLRSHPEEYSLMLIRNGFHVYHKNNQ